jgi:hypothetical protein
MSLKQRGMQPQQVMQMMFQQNPQLNQLMTQFQNMSQGRNPRDFIIQFAQQNGLNQQSIQAMQQMFMK